MKDVFKPGQLLKLNSEFYEAIKILPMEMEENERNLRMLASRYCNALEAWNEKGLKLTINDPPVMYLGTLFLPPNPTTTPYPLPHDKERLIYKFLHKGKIWYIVSGKTMDKVKPVPELESCFVPVGKTHE